MMASSLIFVCSITVFVFITDVKGYIMNNDVLLRDFGNENVEHMEIEPLQTYQENNIVGDNKIVKMVMNPIIDDPAGVNVIPSATDITLVADRAPLTPARRSYITNLLFSSIRAITWYFAKFVLCNIVTIPFACGIMVVLSDEGVDGTLNTPEGVARGLRFVEDIIEMYHDAQKRAALN